MYIFICDGVLLTVEKEACYQLLREKCSTYSAKRGERISETIAAINATNSDIEAHIGISERQIRRYKGGASIPVAALFKLAQLANIDPVYIIYECSEAEFFFCDEEFLIDGDLLDEETEAETEVLCRPPADTGSQVDQKTIQESHNSSLIVADITKNNWLYEHLIDIFRSQTYSIRLDMIGRVLRAKGGHETSHLADSELITQDPELVDLADFDPPLDRFEEAAIHVMQGLSAFDAISLAQEVSAIADPRLP